MGTMQHTTSFLDVDQIIILHGKPLNQAYAEHAEPTWRIVMNKQLISTDLLHCEVRGTCRRVA